MRRRITSRPSYCTSILLLRARMAQSKPNTFAKSAALDVMPVIKDMTRCYHSEERTPATHGYIHVVGKLGPKIERPLLFRLLPR